MASSAGLAPRGGLSFSVVAPEPFSGRAHFLLLSFSRRYELVSGFQFEHWRHPERIRTQSLRLEWRFELAGRATGLFGI